LKERKFMSKIDSTFGEGGGQITPAELKGFGDEIEIGTAESITLLLQCLIPVALFADEPQKQTKD
jgi:RNA 3'-terminal phosphate cyclase